MHRPKHANERNHTLKTLSSFKYALISILLKFRKSQIGILWNPLGNSKEFSEILQNWRKKSEGGGQKGKKIRGGCYAEQFFWLNDTCG